MSRACLHGDDGNGVSVSGAADFTRETFRVDVEVRPSALRRAAPDALDACVVRNLFRPFGAPGGAADPPLYDGYRMADALGGLLEHAPGLFHILLVDALVGTYDEGSMRYHANTVIASNPCIVSLPGMVEAPARPRDYCVDVMVASAAGLDARGVEAKHAGRFLTRGDPRMQDAVCGCIMQALFYFESGEPFCGDGDCRLYNAHRQSELLRAQAEGGGLCRRHRAMLDAMV